MRYQKGTHSRKPLHLTHDRLRQGQVRLVLQAREAIPTHHRVQLTMNFALYLRVQGHVAQEPGQGDRDVLEAVAGHIEEKVVDVLLEEKVRVLPSLHEQQELVGEVSQAVWVVGVLVGMLRTWLLTLDVVMTWLLLLVDVLITMLLLVDILVTLILVLVESLMTLRKLSRHVLKI